MYLLFYDVCRLLCSKTLILTLLHIQLNTFEFFPSDKMLLFLFPYYLYIVPVLQDKSNCVTHPLHKSDMLFSMMYYLCYPVILHSHFGNKYHIPHNHFGSKYHILYNHFGNKYYILHSHFRNKYNNELKVIICKS